MKARHAIVVAVVLSSMTGVILLMVHRSSSIDVELRDSNPAVRAEAIRRLDSSSDADRLLPLLKDENADVRLLCAMQLGGGVAKDVERLAPALVDALKDRHAGVRRAAAETLGNAWPSTEKVLTKALADSDPRVRAGAAFALSMASNGMFDREVTPAQAEPLRPLLRKLLNDEDSEVRQNAGRALERIR
jgi:HEAT repeat protein